VQPDEIGFPCGAADGVRLSDILDARREPAPSDARRTRPSPDQHRMTSGSGVAAYLQLQMPVLRRATLRITQGEAAAGMRAAAHKLLPRGRQSVQPLEERFVGAHLE